MEIIKIKSLSFTYPTSEYPALKNVDFSVNEGELCLVMGKSAAGKSTLLKLLKKEIAPFGKVQGDIEINGEVGYVAQNVNESIVCDKVRSELAFGLVNRGASPFEVELKVNEIASYFNLSNKLDDDISTLSGGEKQILNLASVLITNPKVLVLDEPTCQLDPVSAQKFVNTIIKLNADFGITVVVAEHLLEELYPYAHKVVLVDDGMVSPAMTGEEMIEHLKKNNEDMLLSTPVSMRLFDSAKTTSQCRKVLEKKVLNPVLDAEINADTVLKAKGLYFAYSKNQDVLKDVSLDVKVGKINAILGANSSGKTTLLKTIAGVLKPHHGKIKKAEAVSMLCQNPFDLFTKEKCCDEVAFGDITDFLEISDAAKQHPFDLSTGQAQRLALAKVLETGANIILLDEPTKALDSAFKLKLGEKLRELCDIGKTILLVSHDTDFVAQFADVVSFMSNGEIVATMPRQKMMSSLDFYTSHISKITKGICDSIVSLEDLQKAGGLDE